jgi:hypothetical protein
MLRYQVGGQLSLIKRPSRSELRFEKSFTLALLHSNHDLVSLFPPNQLKSSYVSLSATAALTTPLHIAAKKGLLTAVEHLIRH